MSAPLSFEPNQGQADAGVQFLARGSGYALSLASGKWVLNLERQERPQAASSDTLRMSLVGANVNARVAGLARQTGVVSYFIGNDPNKWRTGIPTYGKVDYVQVYPGVDLVFYGSQRQLEYDFVVAPGADPARIAWRIDGARPLIDREGNLALRAPHGTATFLKPVVYQMDKGRKTTVGGSFAVAGSQVSFRVGSYDHSKPLVIDPVLTYLTYLAGSSTDQISQTTGPGILQNGSGQGIAVDASGSAYVTGRTTSTDFPLKNPYQSAKQSQGTSAPSAFVTKFSPDGASLVYSTYIGGTGWDYGYAIAVDSSGSAYVTGYASSNDFPITPGAYQTVCSPTPNNISPLANAAKPDCNGTSSNAFVTKLSPDGTVLVYSTFLGGFGSSYGTAIAVDSAGRAYVAGNENAPCNTSYVFQGCFPTTAGATIQTINGNNVTNFCFAAVFDPTGANLFYSTLFGDLNGVETKVAAGGTLATGMTVDANGYFYLIGNTLAGKLPGTTGGYQASSGPLDSTGTFLEAYRGFIAKFNPVTLANGPNLAACTYLGGKTASRNDYLSGIAVDGFSNIYVAGFTSSTDFPVTAGAYSTACGGGGSACAAGHVTKLNPTLSAASWSTYVGGSRQDGGDDMFDTGPIQLDGQGNIYVTGVANPQFPMLNSVGPTMCCNGGSVVAELDPTGSNLLFSTSLSGGLDPMETGGLAVDSAGDIYVAGSNIGAHLDTTPGAFQTTNPSPVPTCCYHGFVAKIAPSSPGPAIATASVFNAATSLSGGIAPNEYISIYGTGLGPATGASSQMTTLLEGTSVYIGGTEAFLTYAQDGQLNALAPFGIAGTASTTIQVRYNGIAGNTATVPVVSSSPGIFTQSYGSGQAWMVNQDGSFNSSTNPAARNSDVAFWATGQGTVNVPLQDGVQPSGPPYPEPTLPVSVSIGGVALPAANVLFAGLVYSGEIQINVKIPANAPTGSAVPLVVTIGGASSRSDVTIAIQ